MQCVSHSIFKKFQSTNIDNLNNCKQISTRKVLENHKPSFLEWAELLIICSQWPSK
jgi:hypothetical protein